MGVPMSWAARFRRRQYIKASLRIVPMFGLVLGVLLAELALAAKRDRGRHERGTMRI
ncbi:hypothetical protein AB0L47_10985 [Streptomyces bobili]|uniref:hypothetical protein n=1 Tax=Streptomyces bobili TaxID=67280 RepID=UPI0034194043